MSQPDMALFLYLPINSQNKNHQTSHPINKLTKLESKPIT